MAHTGLVALFLLLGMVLPTVYSVDPRCELLNASASNGNSSAFNLSISPDTLSPNTVYTVTLTGSGNYTVILSSDQGKWSESSINCSGSPLFDIQNGTIIHTNWTSPDNVNVTSVNISAHINTTSHTLIVLKQLSKAENSTVAPNVTSPTGHNQSTTIAPNSGNSTAHTATTATPATTKSGASSVLSSLPTMVFLGLLAVTGKYLS